VWRLVEKVKSQKSKVKTTIQNSKLNDLRRRTHLTIKKVTADMEVDFHFNTAISAIMELVNSVYDVIEKDCEIRDTNSEMREAIETVVILLAPLVPHISEEMWQMLGYKSSIFDTPWPTYDERALSVEKVMIVVQVNGKVRSKIEVSFGIKEEELKNAVLLDEKLKRWLEGKEIRNFVVVPNKLVNIVT